MHRHSLVRSLAAGLAAMFGLGIGAAQAVNYTYTFIDFPASDPACIWSPAMNDLGQVLIADCSPSGAGIGYLWQAGTLTALPQHPNAGPGGMNFYGLDNAGEIVGSYFDASGLGHGFTYMIGTGVWASVDHPVPAGSAGPGYTELRAIALNAGEGVGIVGLFGPLNPYGPLGSYNTGTIYNAHRSVIDSNPADTWQDLDGATDPLYGALNSIVGATTAVSRANGINDLGVIVGRRLAPFRDAFVYQGGSTIPTCPLYSATVSVLPPGCTPRWFSFTYPGAFTTGARGITPAGDVIGWTISDATLTSGNGFVRRHDGSFQQLNVVDPATNNSYVNYTTAYSANSLGQVSGSVYTPAQFAVSIVGSQAGGTVRGARIFIGTPASASTPVPATSCSASSGGCDLSNGTIPHSVTGLTSLPGTVTETTCTVLPDPRMAKYGTCTGHPLPVADVCPGFGTTVIPDYLCGGSGPSNSGFVLASAVAEGVDALSGIYVTSEAYADRALGGTTNPTCPTAVGAWAPRSGSAVEGTIPEGNILLEQTVGCGSSKIGGRGLSIYGIGLTLNTDALPGTTLISKLSNFTVSKYRGLRATVAVGNITPDTKEDLSECISRSQSYFRHANYACAARQIVHFRFLPGSKIT